MIPLVRRYATNSLPPQRVIIRKEAIAVNALLFDLKAKEVTNAPSANRRNRSPDRVVM
jgi:hypothetical protein